MKKSIRDTPPTKKKINAITRPKTQPKKRINSISKANKKTQWQEETSITYKGV
jgi:hypothetical protein